MNNYELQYANALEKKYQSNLRKGQKGGEYILNPLTGRLVNRHGKIGKKLDMIGGGCDDQSEVALSILASKYGLGAPFLGWEPDEDDSGSGNLILGRLSHASGWKTIEEYGSNLDVDAYKLAVKKYVDDLFDSTLRAANAYEWHGGNVFYNEGLNEILRIDWDPNEGDCYIEGCPEPPHGIKTKADYVATLSRLGTRIGKNPPVQPLLKSTDKLIILEDKVIKRITLLKSTSSYSPPSIARPRAKRQKSNSPRGSPVPMGKLLF